MNDADIETAALNASADHEAALKRHGVCAHGWTQDQPGGGIRCLDCGAWFADGNEHQDARDEVLM